MAWISSIMTGPVVPTHAFSQYTNPIIPELRIPYILDRNLRSLDGVSTNTNPGSVSNGVSSSSTLRILFIEAEGNTWCTT